MYLNISSKTIKIIASLGFLFTSVNAQSAFIDNGLTITDTFTDLEWLELTQTQNFSYNQVESELLAGGLFDEYRRATENELDTLFANLELTSGPVNAKHLEFINLFGETTNQDGYAESFGYGVASAGPFPSAPVYGLDFVVANGIPSYGVNTGELSHNPSINFDGFGSFLVKPIPEPAVIWLLGSGLLGLTFIRRKRFSAKAV